MNPLMTLWLFVFLSMAVVTFAFWLAENYLEYFSNFYVLLGVFFGAIILSRVISWVWNRLHRRSA